MLAPAAAPEGDIKVPRKQSFANPAKEPESSMALFRNAHECLHAVVARYAAIQTYTDVGGVRPIGTVGPASCWFETHFAAPERYRFQPAPGADVSRFPV